MHGGRNVVPRGGALQRRALGRPVADKSVSLKSSLHQKSSTLSGWRFSPQMVRGAISNPYAGTNRVRFKGFPRCRSASGFSAPCRGSPWNVPHLMPPPRWGQGAVGRQPACWSTAVSWNKCCRVAKGAGRSKQLLVGEMRLCPTLVVVLENLL